MIDRWSVEEIGWRNSLLIKCCFERVWKLKACVIISTIIILMLWNCSLKYLLYVLYKLIAVKKPYLFYNYIFLLVYCLLYNNKNVHSLLCSCGLCYKPLGVSKGSPWLHFFYSIVQCLYIYLYVVTKIKFIYSSIHSNCTVQNWFHHSYKHIHILSTMCIIYNTSQFQK